jgi:hypothetical protein
MEQEDKVLLVDLCARLPYHPIVYVDENLPRLKLGVATRVWEYIAVDKPCKPYLRPMSSMTEEEKEELLNRLPKYWGLEIDKLGDLYFDICDASYPDIELLTDIIDWLNAHHFDYRGLIEKGLALEAPEGMYK